MDGRGYFLRELHPFMTLARIQDHVMDVRRVGPQVVTGGLVLSRIVHIAAVQEYHLIVRVVLQLIQVCPKRFQQNILVSLFVERKLIRFLLRKTVNHPDEATILTGAPMRGFQFLEAESH